MRAEITPEQQRWYDSLPTMPGFLDSDDQPDFAAADDEFDYFKFSPADISRMWASGDPQLQGLVDYVLDHHRAEQLRTQNEFFLGQVAADSWPW